MDREDIHVVIIRYFHKEKERVLLSSFVGHVNNSLSLRGILNYFVAFNCLLVQVYDALKMNAELLCLEVCILVQWYVPRLFREVCYRQIS